MSAPIITPDERAAALAERPPVSARELQLMETVGEYRQRIESLLAEVATLQACQQAFVSTDVGDGHPVRRVAVRSPWGESNDVEFSGWSQPQTEKRVQEYPGLAGSASLTVDTGACKLSLSATVADLQALSALCARLAADQQRANDQAEAA